MTKSLNYNHATGEIIERDLTSNEISELEFLSTQIKTKENENATARVALLERLGITAEEAQLILGGSN